MRSKYLLFTMVMALLFSGCGQKSTIKNNVEAEKLACAYGDCKHIIQNLTFPLDDPSFAFKTPLLGLGPIAGGLIKFVGDIFARTKGGRVEFSYIQPVPELPESLHAVRVKRLFLYMKPKKSSGLNEEEEAGFVRENLERYVLGKEKTNFDFIGLLGMRLSATVIKESHTYEPIFKEGLGSEISNFMNLFENSYRSGVVDTEIARELMLVKYQNTTKKSDTVYKKFGRIHYLETTKDPAAMKKLFQDSPEFQGHYKRIVLLRNSILIELNKDPVANEMFKFVMARYDSTLKDLGLNFVDTCSEKKCLELKIPEVNLVPFAEKGNALKLDALLQPHVVPDSFNIKGFVEFEVKIDSKA